MKQLSVSHSRALHKLKIPKTLIRSTIIGRLSRKIKSQMKAGRSSGLKAKCTKFFSLVYPNSKEKKKTNHGRQRRNDYENKYSYQAAESELK